MRYTRLEKRRDGMYKELYGERPCVDRMQRLDLGSLTLELFNGGRF
jgi:hypothetical protein